MNYNTWVRHLCASTVALWLLLSIACKESQVTIGTVRLSVQHGRQFESFMLSCCTQVSLLNQIRHLRWSQWSPVSRHWCPWKEWGSLLLLSSRAIHKCLSWSPAPDRAIGQSFHSEGEFVSIEWCGRAFCQHTQTPADILMVAQGSGDVWEIHRESSSTKCLRRKGVFLWYKDDDGGRRLSYIVKYSYCAGGRDKPGLPAKVSSLCYGTDRQSILHSDVVQSWALLFQSLGSGSLFIRAGRCTLWMVNISHLGSGLETIPEWEAEKKMQAERRRK